MLYTAKAIAANNTHKSPILNDIFNRIDNSPFVISKRTPISTIIIPRSLFRPIYSLNITLDNIITIIGNVIDIIDKFNAGLVCEAR